MVGRARPGKRECLRHFRHPVTPGTLSLPPDREKQTSFAAERPHPANLGHPVLDIPVIDGRFEEVATVIAEDGAWECAQVLDPAAGEPVLHLSERVSMLFRMLILVA